jgi:aquaporin Z
MNLKNYIAEFIGTFVLVLFGCGTAVAANTLLGNSGMTVPLGFSTLLIALAFGLSIVAMAYSIGNISGCHINPAVSAGMLAAGRMTVKDFVGYIISQFLGALIAAVVLYGIVGSKTSLGQNGYGDSSAMGSTMMQALFIEIILTFVFVLVILVVTSKPEHSTIAGIVIGLTLALIHMLGIPFTGTSVNPARSFGPAVLVGGNALKQLPVFIIAPLIGGILAAVVYIFLFNDGKQDAAPAEEAA